MISKAQDDNKAFELLMSNHLKVIYNYIGIHVKSDEDIEDIVQETMLAVWSGLKSFRHDSSFRTWIIGITRRKICDFYRSKYKISSVSIFDAEDLLKTEDESEQLIKAVDVKNAITSLNKTEQELVFLAFTAQLTYQEISEITGIPVGTVKSRMFTVKSKLRKHLEKEWWAITDCQSIQEILIDYLNSRLAQKDKNKVVVHLSGCEKCREEMAFLIKLKNYHTEKLKEVPQAIKSSAFSLIPETKPQHRSWLYLDSLYDALELADLTIRFAIQII